MSKRLIILFSILIAGLLIYVIANAWEYYNEEQDLGWSREAKQNPFLAAQLYLEKQDKHVDSFSSYNKLDSLTDIDTLFVSNSSHILSDKRLTSLVRWIEDGGHLIIAARHSHDLSEDRILRYFDISKLYNSKEDFESKPKPEDEKTDELDQEELTNKLQELTDKLSEKKADDIPAEQRIHNYEQGISADHLTTLSFNNVDEDIRVHFNYHSYLDHPYFYEEDDHVNTLYSPFYWSGDEYGVHFIQFEVGSGLLSVLSDADVLSSKNIDKFDHAFFWDILVSQSQNTHILYGVDMPSFWTILKKYSPEILIAFSIWLFLWIWFKIRRFGVIRNTNATIRRSMAEHIFSGSLFLWRNHCQLTLLNSVRNDISRKAERVITQYASSNSDTKMILLSKASKLDLALVADSMASSNTLSENNFLQTVQTLQQIRKSL